MPRRSQAWTAFMRLPGPDPEAVLGTTTGGPWRGLPARLSSHLVKDSAATSSVSPSGTIPAPMSRRASPERAPPSLRVGGISFCQRLLRPVPQETTAQAGLRVNRGGSERCSVGRSYLGPRHRTRCLERCRDRSRSAAASAATAGLSSGARAGRLPDLHFLDCARTGAEMPVSGL